MTSFAEDQFNGPISEVLSRVMGDALIEPSVFWEKQLYAQKLSDISVELFNRDSHCEAIDNDRGHYCGSYPRKIVIPIKPKNTKNVIDGQESLEDSEEALNYKTLFDDIVTYGRFGRARCRFPVPVMQVFGKYICRSSTLSSGKEIVAQATVNKLKSFFGFGHESAKKEISLSKAEANEAFNSLSYYDQWVGSCRQLDIQLLQSFGITDIFDLMVENKKVKYGMYVSSSEKIDRENRYKNFSLNVIPYPGCEFFTEFSKNQRNGKDLFFDWKQNEVNALLKVTNPVLNGIDFSSYKTWDLNEITKNYLLILLNRIKDGSNGLLVHCISGWDRTPMFISLLRLSLWADGLIHESLSVCEIVFLTTVYDWLMFSHNFKNRYSKKEEIMYYCFATLEAVAEEEFSLIPDDFKPNMSSSTNFSCSFCSHQSTSSDQQNGKAIENNQVIIPNKNCCVQKRASSRPEALLLRKKRLLTARDLFISAYESLGEHKKVRKASLTLSGNYS